MNRRSIARSVSLLAVGALAPLCLAAGEANHNIELQKEGIGLIRQVEEVARDVRYNAGRLNSFTSTSLISKWTHLHHLAEIKSLVNEGLAPALDRLAEIQPQLPEWKQQSVDKMMSAARTLAADTNAAIVSKQDAGTVPPFLNAEYKTLVSKIYEHAEALVKTSDAAGTYAVARLKAAEAGLKPPTT